MTFSYLFFLLIAYSFFGKTFEETEKNNRDRYKNFKKTVHVTGKQFHKKVNKHLHFKSRTQKLFHPFCTRFL